MTLEQGLNEFMQVVRYYLLHYLVYFKRALLSFRNLFVQNPLVLPALIIHVVFSGKDSRQQTQAGFLCRHGMVSSGCANGNFSEYSKSVHHSTLGSVWWFVVNIHKT